MVIASRYTWTSLLIALVVLVTVFAFGCARSSTPQAGSNDPSALVGSRDMPSLAGRWVGNIYTFRNEKSTAGIWDLTPSGDYTTWASGFTATGKAAAMNDGNLVLTNTSTTRGTSTAPGTGKASLSRRSDGVLVLTGYGQSDFGPFTFVMTRQ